MNKKTFGIKLRKKDALELYYVIDEAIWSLVLGHHCLDKSGNDFHGTVYGASVENAPSGDDGLVYEEGTWTPVATSYDGATDHGEAKYTRIGNMCYATCRLATASSGAVNDGSHVIISGLPYNAISGQTGWGGFVTRFPGGGVLSYHMHKQGDNDRFAFYDGGGADVTYNELGWDTNSKSLYITIMYQVN